MGSYRILAVPVLTFVTLVGAVLPAQVPCIQTCYRASVQEHAGSGLPSARLDLRAWLRGFSDRRSAPRVFLHVPKPSPEPVIPVVVSTSLPGARAFQIDVDLNHDGRFEGPGELGYAEGRFDPSGAGQVRLHGLVHGHYQVRARVGSVDLSPRYGVSAIGRVEVLPTPPNQLPVCFEVNKGQTDAAVVFLGRAKNQTVYVTADETMLVTRASSQRFRLVGANASARPIGRKELPGASNYFIGNDPSRW